MLPAASLLKIKRTSFLSCSARSKIGQMNTVELTFVKNNEIVLIFLSISVDDASIYEFMSLAETVALRLVNEEGNLEGCLRWYEVIIKFANCHGTY